MLHSLATPWTTSLLYGALGVCIGLGLRTLVSRRLQSTAFLDDTGGGGGEYKMVLLVRSDLAMGKGKAAAQCCHAALEVYKETQHKYPQIVREWEACGQPKVVLKVESEDELKELVGKARKAGVCAQWIRDAGRTQLAAGTKSVAAIGPGVGLGWVTV